MKVVALITASVAVLAVGCGSSDGLSKDQVNSLKTRSEQFKKDVNGATASMSKCKSAGSVKSIETCLGRAMDDVSVHTMDFASWTRGLAASTGGSCRVDLDAMATALAAQGRLFAKSADQIRAGKVNSFKKTVNSVSSAGLTAAGNRADKSCA